MSENSQTLALKSDLVTFCGRPGWLEPIGDIVDESPSGADSCWVWRTDRGLLQSLERPVGGSLLNLACDVAELYHQRCVLQLGAVPSSALEVMWLELAADNSLLVFLKPVSLTYA